MLENNEKLLKEQKDLLENNEKLLKEQKDLLQTKAPNNMGTSLPCDPHFTVTCGYVDQLQRVDCP